MRLVPRIAAVGTVERLARIGYSALEVSAWRRVFILFRITYSCSALRRTGEPFWQAESYGHWVRDGRELKRIWDNIENKLP